jgi:hypothetical protein
MFTNEFQDDEYTELQRSFDILSDRSQRLDYEKDGSVEKDNVMMGMLISNTFYAGWMLVGIAITSSSRTEQARCHLFAFLALLALVEFKV